MAGCKPLGPGPGCYKLPTLVGFPGHDPCKTRYPMYSFGAAGCFSVKKVGPGPCYKVDRITREGAMFAPAWSFGSRFPTRGILKTPGPGAHAPERCPPMKDPRAPCYSLGARLGYQCKSRGPAPNTYNIRCGPGTPAWSMGMALGRDAKPVSPGPACYFQRDQSIYKTRAPIYSLGARLGGPGKPTKTPGPAAYPPGLYNTKKSPPCYSFGTQHSPCAPPMIVKEDTMDCL